VIDRFWELSEFLVLAVLAIAILVAGAIAEDIDGALAWTLVAVLGAAYILSRGLARRDRDPGVERTGRDRERFGR